MTKSDYLRDGRFELIAHRGGSLEAPENTLAAFRNAYKIFNDSVFEIDVHLSRDGEVVVIHDDRIDRTSNGTGRVFDFTFKELSQFDAGYRFELNGEFPFRGKGVRFPLLKEVLEEFPYTRISIEVKEPYPQAEEKVLALIDKYNARRRIVLAAAKHNILKKLRSLAPEMCSGYSEKEIYWNVVFLKLKLGLLAPQRGDVYQIPIEWNGTQVLTPALMRLAKKSHKHIHVWTVDDEATMKILIKQGINGIITDKPTLLLRVCRELIPSFPH